MGWLNGLFAGRHNEATPDPNEPAITMRMDGATFSMPGDPEWYGLCCTSPNGRWLVSWAEGAIISQDKGPHLEEDGAYLLYDTQTKQVMAQGRLGRPNNGQVADNGMFLLEDWKRGDDLIGAVCVFNLRGKKLFSRTFAANVLTSALSPKGRYAVCHTCVSPSQEGSSLFLFDLVSGKQMFMVPARAGQASGYVIDEQRVEIIAHIDGLGDFRYGSFGEFEEEGALEEAQLRKGDYPMVMLAVKSILKRSDVPIGRMKEALLAIQRVCHDGVDPLGSRKASALKAEGGLREMLGDTAQALVLYRQAMALDPKMGLNVKIAALDTEG